MAGPVIYLENLRFAWRRGDLPCLDIRHFVVEAGERVFLEGESGSGKSTLLQLIAGVLRPAAGTLSIVGTSLPDLTSSRRDRFRGDHLGVIFQQFNLVPYLSAWDNVRLPCRFSARRRQRAGNSERDEAARLLARLDLAEPLWRQRAAALSVGEQQRVAVARALIGRPELIIADEPTSALDEGRRNAFLDLLLDECRASGATLLFVSHDPRLAPLFDRAVRMSDINRRQGASA